RAGLLLTRTEALHGWGSAGFAGDPFAGSDLDWQLPAIAAAGDCRGVVELDAEAVRALGERLGFHGEPGSAAWIPMVLRDRTAALLYVDGDGLDLAPLQLLVAITARQIELLGLAERSWTPTLYRAAEAPEGGLPRWDAAAEAPASREVAVAAAPAIPDPVPATPAVAPAPTPEPAPSRFPFEDFAAPAAPPAAAHEPPPEPSPQHLRPP